MNLREEYARMQRLKAVAQQWTWEPARVAELIQPFIDKYKNLRLERRNANETAVAHPRHGDLSDAIRGVGAQLHAFGLRGITFHNTFQRALAELAPAFGYRGFTECFAGYDDETEKDAVEHSGRMDVVWAVKRVPQVLFEIDRTVKRVSLRKLQGARGAHKYWIYFGPDVWEFKTALKKWDPAGEIRPVIIPNTFVPKWQREKA